MPVCAPNCFVKETVAVAATEPARKRRLVADTSGVVLRFLDRFMSYTRKVHTSEERVVLIAPGTLFEKSYICKT